MIFKNKYQLSFLVFTLPQLMKNLLSRMDGVQTPIIAVVGQLLKAKPGTISLAQGIVS
ncbi:hypothetical protein [Microcystis sp. M20BS1]|uniref:hypothetical protein n=1 Tax=Microcystis sp. M20BS1 TaxID=2771181 RepID=UPI00257B70AD|nr:hypothetical protein [Microcystis sp. M20BS1]